MYRRLNYVLLFFLSGSTALVGPRLFSVSLSIFLQSAGLHEWVISSLQGLYQNSGREMADNFAQRPPWGLRFFNVQ
jgi:hypothetical protein